MVLVLALGALTVSLLAGDDAALAIAAADGVVVELPDGDSIVGEAGTELPDGTRLDVIGFVEIDGRRFGPGTYEIVDGAVVARDDGESEGSDRGGTGPPASDGSVGVRRGPGAVTPATADRTTPPTEVIVGLAATTGPAAEAIVGSNRRGPNRRVRPFRSGHPMRRGRLPRRRRRIAPPRCRSVRRRRLRYARPRPSRRRARRQRRPRRTPRRRRPRRSSPIGPRLPSVTVGVETAAADGACYESRRDRRDR